MLRHGGRFGRGYGYMQNASRVSFPCAVVGSARRNPAARCVMAVGSTSNIPRLPDVHVALRVRGEDCGCPCSRGAEPRPPPAEHCTTPSLLVLPCSTPALPRSCCAEAMAEWRRAERLKNTNAVSKPGPFSIGDRSFYLKLLCEGGLHGRRKPVWRKCVHGPSRREIPMGWRKPSRLMCTRGHPLCRTDAKAWRMVRPWLRLHAERLP